MLQPWGTTGTIIYCKRNRREGKAGPDSLDKCVSKGITHVIGKTRHQPSSTASTKCDTWLGDNRLTRYRQRDVHALLIQINQVTSSYGASHKGFSRRFNLC